MPKRPFHFSNCPTFNFFKFLLFIPNLRFINYFILNINNLFLQDLAGRSTPNLLERENSRTSQNKRCFDFAYLATYLIGLNYDSLFVLCIAITLTKLLYYAFTSP